MRTLAHNRSAAQATVGWVWRQPSLSFEARSAKNGPVHQRGRKRHSLRTSSQSGGLAEAVVGDDALSTPNTPNLRPECQAARAQACSAPFSMARTSLLGAPMSTSALASVPAHSPRKQAHGLHLACPCGGAMPRADKISALPAKSCALRGVPFLYWEHRDARRRLEDKPPYLALGARMPSAGRTGCSQPAAVDVSCVARRRRAKKEAHDHRSRNSLRNGNEFCEPLYTPPARATEPCPEPIKYRRSQHRAAASARSAISVLGAPMSTSAPASVPAPSPRKKAHCLHAACPCCGAMPRADKISALPVQNASPAPLQSLRTKKGGSS